jgi:hypothetical protein
MAVLPLAAWQLRGVAQAPSLSTGRFEFQIVESFDAKYLGDTPGHIGRGGLHGVRPDVAVGDPVYRKNVRIGQVTGLTWDRTKENLEIEFDPVPFEEDAQGRPMRPTRVSVGTDVWLPLGGSVGLETKR